MSFSTLLLPFLVTILFLILVSLPPTFAQQQQGTPTTTTTAFTSENQFQITTSTTTISNPDGNETEIPPSSTQTPTTRRFVPPFNYTGYFVNKNAQFSTALSGLCRWTTSTSLCVFTVIPILLITFIMLLVLIYNCIITPQKEALMNAAAVRDSPLWPASLRSLTDEEVQELVTSSSGLALKDLFPLLGLESLVQRAAALGLATLKDLMCANALAVRDIGIEVREQRIMARSLERIATHAKKVVAERQKSRKDKKQNGGVTRGRGGSTIGRGQNLLAAALGASSFPSGSKSLDTNIIIDPSHSLSNALAAAAGVGGQDDDLRGPRSSTNFGGGYEHEDDNNNNNVNTTEIAPNPFGVKKSVVAKSSNNTPGGGRSLHQYRPPSILTSEEEELEQLRSVASTVYGSPGGIVKRPLIKNQNNTNNASANNASATASTANSNHQNQNDDDHDDEHASASVGKEKWKKLKGRIAAYSLMEKLAGGASARRRGSNNNDDDEDDDYDYDNDNDGYHEKQQGAQKPFMDI